MEMELRYARGPAFTAGYDISSKEAYGQTLREFDNVAGIEMNIINLILLRQLPDRND